MNLEQLTITRKGRHLMLTLFSSKLYVSFDAHVPIMGTFL